MRNGVAWKPGDPIGMGEVCLPDSKSKVAYADACRAAMLDSAARYAMKLRTIYQRRAYISKYPPERQDALKARIMELWGTKR